ncbi:MAG TPA: zf-HC2 domain-containing protein [Candidatus Acidoferrum sp.]|nr:zf-HC2 domain-containing protein [Candidatus Acidoferrum sp.]
MSALSRFTCEETFRRLDDYLDRELTADEMRLVGEHLEICAACASEFNFEESVLTGVKRKLRQLDLPDDLQARVAAALVKASGS